MTASSFEVTKQLRVTLTLGAPGATFAQTGDNTLILTGMRISASVQVAARFAGQLDLSIYGMRAADMNSLTVLFFGPEPSIQLNNTVLLEANGGDGWTQVFFGTIFQGVPEYRDMPDVPFHIQGMFGYFNGNGPVAPLSYPQGVSVAQAVQTVANQMNVQFENNGVTAYLSPGSYFPGSSLDQLRAICHAADVDYYTLQNILVICPKGEPRLTAQSVLLTPETGLIGYPRIEVGGIGFDCYFNPAVTAGGLVQVAGSDIPAANGSWMPYWAVHTLESWARGGQWQSAVKSYWQASA